jgi:hypothetical protein
MSEKVKVDILRLEIGYQSKSSDTHCNEEPPNQRRLMEILDDTVWGGFLKSRSVEVDRQHLPQDQWVAHRIEKEINAALDATADRASGGARKSAPDYHVRVLPHHLRLLRPLPAPHPSDRSQTSEESPERITSGYDGTICKKIGKIWENARSYELHFAHEPEGQPKQAWPRGLNPEDSVMYATLVWQCWPKK